MSLYTDIVETSRAYPDNIALTLEDRNIKYHDLHKKIDALYHGLRVAQFGRGETIGIVLHNSAEFAVALYALSRLGCVAALIDPRLPSAEIVREYKRLQLSALIIENYAYRNLLKIEPEFGRGARFVVRSYEGDDTPYISRLIQVGWDYLTVWRPSEFVKEDRSEDRALIQCSSGTTGERKCAYRTHGNIGADLANITSTFGYRKTDSFYCPVPLCHGYGLTMGLLAPIRCGARVIIDRFFMINRAMEVLRRFRPTVFVGIPSMYDSMVQDQCSEIELRSLRYCMCSGDRLSENTAFRFHESYGRWINQIYGMMEASLISANVDADMTNVLSVGRPARNVSIAFEHGSSSINSRVAEGEVCVKSDAISPAYLSEVGITNLPKKGRWFLTGDWGYWDARGDVLYVVGRRGEQ